MIARSRHYFQAHIMRPLRNFLEKHCPDEKAAIMSLAEQAWRRPRDPKKIEINLDEDRPIPLSFCSRGLTAVELAILDSPGAITRTLCRYESFRSPKEENNRQYRRAWNSPHDEHAERDESNHHTFWHQHIGTQKGTELPYPDPATVLELFEDYLTWLSSQLEE